MDIDGLGSAIVETLIEHKMLTNPADLYQLDYDAIAELPGQGKKSAENLKNSIEASKQNDLSRLLCAFGIRQVGTKAAKTLAAAFGSLYAIMNASEEELEAFHTKEYIDFLSNINPRNMKEYEDQMDKCLVSLLL